ncbi:hypothetical protein ABID52_001657 [Fictibacillus halophilus]|uniref:Uncharacterized protein n=1 Tax=Fictibacillus halophilus TaxID=1610490 RepID=A0ABV2LHN6_9BACL
MGRIQKYLLYFVPIYLTLIAFDFFRYQELMLLENLIIPLLYVMVVFFLDWSKPKGQENKS